MMPHLALAFLVETIGPRQKAQHPDRAHRRITDLGQEGLGPAYSGEQCCKARSGNASLVHLLVEDASGDLLDVPADAFKLVRKSVDDGVEHPDQGGRSVAHQTWIPTRMLGKSAHRLWSGITNCHEPIVGEHEADRRSPRIAVLNSIEDADGHVERPVPLI